MALTGSGRPARLRRDDRRRMLLVRAALLVAATASGAGPRSAAAFPAKRSTAASAGSVRRFASDLVTRILPAEVACVSSPTPLGMTLARDDQGPAVDGAPTASHAVDPDDDISIHSNRTETATWTTAARRGFDAAVNYRFACKKFRRADGTERHATGAARCDPAVVRQAIEALELARQSPSAYNAQPYKFVVVHSRAQKEAIAPFALGPNRNRVLDADATVVFLADRQVLRTLPQFRRQLTAKGKWTRWKLQLYLAVFSSGYPLPRCINAVFSFLVRTGVALVHLLTRSFYPMPTLSSAETWAGKQATMVAMTYMLACAARGLDTLPMEGIHAGGLRRALGVPSRYAVPLIVSTGHAYEAQGETAPVERSRPERYPMDEMVFGDRFGASIRETLEGSLPMAGPKMGLA